MGLESNTQLCSTLIEELKELSHKLIVSSRVYADISLFSSVCKDCCYQRLIMQNSSMIGQSMKLLESQMEDMSS